MNPDDDADFEDTNRVELTLYEKYGIEDTDGFERLIRDLTKMIAIDRSELTKKIYRGFAKGNTRLYRSEIEETVKN
jgi:hypothetical protein